MRLVVGRVGRPHGLRGEVTVELRTDSPDHRFAVGTALLTDPPRPDPLVVEGAHWHAGRLLLRFAGVADRTAAEALRDIRLVVDVPDDEVPEDPEEFYDHQLTGLAAVTVAGEDVGVVTEVLHLPSQDLLAVRRADGREVLVPFVTEIVPQVDLAGRRVVLAPPPGLIDDLPDDPRPDGEPDDGEPDVRDVAAPEG
jgi:16S rRNA processing protein RimM